jgi:hypothetical protein
MSIRIGPIQLVTWRRLRHGSLWLIGVHRNRCLGAW